MKLAVFATLIVTTAAFGINKADLGKVRFDEFMMMKSSRSIPSWIQD
jgi:hypothetical protein